MRASAPSEPQCSTCCSSCWSMLVGMGAVAASTLGAIAGALVNYSLNHRFTFASDKAHRQALPRFAVVAVGRHRVERDRSRCDACLCHPALSRGAGGGHRRRARCRVSRESRMDVLSPAASSIARVDQAPILAVGRRAGLQRGGGAARIPSPPRRGHGGAVSPCAEIIYVNDGSRDGSAALLAQFNAEDARVAVIELSRNFGKEIAMTAGLDHAAGDAVVVIDSDLQDPPELIPDMVRAWREGVDVVLMRRASRAQESWFKKATASAFYRAIGRTERHRHPRERRRFPPAVAACSRGLPETARAQPLHEGAVRVDRLSVAGARCTTATGVSPARPSGTIGNSGTSRWRASLRSRRPP